MGKDPARDARRAQEAERLGITPEELRAQRKAEQASSLEAKATELGVTVEEYVAEHRKKKRAGRPYRGTQPTPAAEEAPGA
jgi:hypothetical protein